MKLLYVSIKGCGFCRFFGNMKGAQVASLLMNSQGIVPDTYDTLFFWRNLPIFPTYSYFRSIPLNPILDIFHHFNPSTLSK